jgi:hypothetical protein
MAVVTVIATEADLVGSDIAATVTVTLRLVDGILVGALYEAINEPPWLASLLRVPPPVAGETLRVTPLGSLVVPTISKPRPGASIAVAGLSETVIPVVRLGTVAVAEVNFKGSATEVAVMVTLRVLAALAGAAYVTDVLVPPVSIPEPVAGEMVHVTPLLEGSLFTVAVNVCVPPACTVAVTGDTVTVTGGGGVTCPPPHPKLPTASSVTKTIAKTDAHSLCVTAKLLLVPVRTQAQACPVKLLLLEIKGQGVSGIRGRGKHLCPTPDNH